MSKKSMAVFFMAALVTAVPAVAQSEAPTTQSSEFYRLDFAIKEMEGGKVIKTRNYEAMIASSYQASSIRSGAKVPVVDAKGTTYIDVGVNVDVHDIKVTKEGLELSILAEASGTVDTGTGGLTKQPIIYQTKWNSRVELPLGKATTLFSSDDPASKHQLQLEVTATKVR